MINSKYMLIKLILRTIILILLQYNKLTGLTYIIPIKIPLYMAPGTIFQALCTTYHEHGT